MPMDEFTARLLAEDAERAEHPQRYTIHFICRECGKVWSAVYSKSEVEDLKQRNKGSTTILTYCSECLEKAEDD